ncbi:MAG: hypothetical protein QF659_09400, partial [Dehalococcoidia bacterium]|nr:hypothetical protein [Dehalococcoidia bacterium]
DLEDPGEEAGGSHHSLIAGMKVFPLLLRIPIMKVTLVVTLGGFFFWHGLNDWLPEILRDGGMTAAEAGFWAVLPIVVGIGTTLVVPPMAKPSRRIPMLIGFFLAAGAAGGLYFMVGEVGGVLGPLFLGIIADLSGGFLASLLMLAAMSVVLAVLSGRIGFLLRKEA